MSFTILLAAALIGPEFDAPAEFWRGEFQSVMQASAARAKAPPEAMVLRLVKFYGALEELDVLSQAERNRMRKSLETRLVRQLEELVREKKSQDARLQREARRSSPQSLSGGGAGSVAQPLIDLIVATINPGSWRHQGGQGSISYYPNNPALIIRQTQQAHEEIAELLQALR